MLADCNIPWRTCLGSAVVKKVKKLDKIDREIIQVSPISSDIFNLCMTIYFLENIITRICDDGQMVSKAFHQYSSFSIQYIDKPSDTSKLWVFKSHLINFKHSTRCHTGVRVGEELIEVIMKFGLQEKVSVQYMTLLS